MDLIITLQDRIAKMYDAESMLIDTAQEMILFSNTLFRTRKKNWKPEEFRQETFFVLADDREEMQLDCVRAIGSKYGFVPNICSVNSMESILMNVENGLGVTVCNSWVRNVYEPGFQCCPLEHSTEIAAVWKQGQENSALQILLGYMTEKNLNKLQNQRINDIVQIADMAVNKPCATVKIRGSWLENSRLLLFRWTGDMKREYWLWMMKYQSGWGSGNLRNIRGMM